MTKRKMPIPKLSAREVMQGKQYSGIKGKVVHWADHAFEEGILYPFRNAVHCPIWYAIFC
jgi:hypothetical protein